MPQDIYIEGQLFTINTAEESAQITKTNKAQLEKERKREFFRLVYAQIENTRAEGKNAYVLDLNGIRYPFLNLTEVCSFLADTLGESGYYIERFDRNIERYKNCIKISW